MKKLITILILLALSGQAAMDVFQLNESGIGYLHEFEDHCEKGGEEKKVKEWLIVASGYCEELFHNTIFDCYSCLVTVSPLLDLLKPPPDVTL